MKSSRLLLGCSLLLLSHVIMADDEAGWTFIPSIAYQTKQLNFDQLYTDDVSKPINENGRKSHFQLNLPTINLSLTTAYKKFYVALKYEKSLTEGAVSVDETLPPSGNGVYFLNIPGHDTKVDRKDQSITFGYNAWNNLNVFAGYMAGETRLTPEPSCCNLVNLALDLEDDLLNANGNYFYHQVYTEKGPFVGFSYGWRVGEASTLSASYAYARMKGEFKDNYITTPPPVWTGYGDEHFDYAGNSIGSSIGITWSSPLSETSSYFIDIRQQKYSMDAGSTNVPYAYNRTIRVKTDETMRGLTMGVQRFF